MHTFLILLDSSTVSRVRFCLDRTCETSECTVPGSAVQHADGTFSPLSRHQLSAFHVVLQMPSRATQGTIRVTLQTQPRTTVHRAVIVTIVTNDIHQSATSSHAHWARWQGMHGQESFCGLNVNGSDLSMGIRAYARELVQLERDGWPRHIRSGEGQEPIRKLAARGTQIDSPTASQVQTYLQQGGAHVCV